MASTASPPPAHASPAHSYHNRFAKEAEATSPTRHDQGSATSAAASASAPFSFDFSEFKGLDSGDDTSLGSFLAYQQPKAEQPRQEAPAQPEQQPEPQQQVEAAPQAAADHLETSQDVATLEEAVAKQESQSQTTDSASSVSHGRAPLPRPPVIIDSVDSPADQQSQASSQDAPQPTTVSASSSARSLSKQPVGNFSRPSNAVPSGSVASQDSGLERGMDSLDLNGSRDAMPQLRTVQAAQQPILSPASGTNSSNASTTAFPSTNVEELAQPTPRQNIQERERPSSFFGLQGPPASTRQSTVDGPYTNDSGSGYGGAPSSSGVRPSSFFQLNNSEPTSVEHNNSGGFSRDDSGLSAPLAQNRSTLAGGTGNAAIQHSGSFNYGSGNGRPASIAPSVSTGPLLDHSHLKPGEQAALLSHNKTLELYRQNAKKTNDPDLIYEFAVFMIDASKSMPESPSGAVGIASGSKEDVIKEAIGLLKKIAERGHADAQYFLADCYANGIGTPKAKQDFDRAYPLFVLAAKHGHPDAAYRAGTCYEKGWGCRRDSGKALQFYRKAAAQSHPGAMYRLATAELNGELGLKRSAKEGVKWLKRSADAATPEFPHALHELALLHERGIDNVLFVDPEYSCELLAQAGEMGYAPSAYKLGVNYEYGRMGCPQDAGLSIHMYNIAAQQNHKEACFALTAWYLVGAPSILPQSDTEAYLWAKKAAEQNLAKAEYAVGYFTEMGIGTVKDLKEAKEWYKRAAEHGDKRANQRLTGLGGRPVGPLPGVGAGGATNGKESGKAGQHGQTPAGSDYASMPAPSRTQPTNAPFPSRVDVSAMSPSGTTTFPSPLAMRDTQSAQREERYLANVAAVQQAEYRAANPQQRPPQPTQQQRPPQPPMQQQQQQRPPMQGPPSSYGPPQFPQQQQRPGGQGSPSGPQQQPQRSMTGPPGPGGAWPGAPNGNPNGFAPGRPPSAMSSPPLPQHQNQQQPRPPTNGMYGPHGGPGSPNRSGSLPPHSAASAYPSYQPSAGSPPGPARPPPINTNVSSMPGGGGPRPPPSQQQNQVPGPRYGAGYPSPYGQQQQQPQGQQSPPQQNGGWRPSPMSNMSIPMPRPPQQQQQHQQAPGMTSPRQQPNGPGPNNTYASPMMSPPMGAGGNNGVNIGSGPGGMPFGIESDDATAAQIYQRAQQAQQNGAEQPKKKKGWFGGK